MRQLYRIFIKLINSGLLFVLLNSNLMAGPVPKSSFATDIINSNILDNNQVITKDGSVMNVLKICYKLKTESDDRSSINVPSPVIINRGNIINVKDKFFGAKGDGVSIDRGAVQAAIDFVMGRGGGTVYFPKGTYLVYGIRLAPNIILSGEGKRESILKAPDHVDQLIGSKFWRMFVTATAPRTYKYEGDTDSAPLSFQNLTIDYNGLNQVGWNDGSNREQNFCIELGASANKPGRLKVIIDNCEIRHSVTDGISVLANVDCTVTDCLFKTNRRGSIVLLGGHSVTRAKDITVLNDLGEYVIGLQSEVCLLGYGKTRKSDFYVEDSYVEGQIDIGMTAIGGTGGDGTIISLKNVDASKGDYLFGGHGAVFTAENSKFGAMGGWMLMMEKATFTNCQFILTKNLMSQKIPDACINLKWNMGTSWKNQLLTFNNCTFTADDTVSSKLARAAIVVTLAEKTSRNNKVVVNGGLVTNKLVHAFKSWYAGMGHAEFNGVTINSSGYAFRMKAGSLVTDSEFHLKVNNIKLTNGGYFFIEGGSYADNHLNQSNITVMAPYNLLASAQAGFEKLTVTGTRTILGSDPPTAQTCGFVGDLYQLQDGSQRRCDATGYFCQGLNRHISAKWSQF